MNVYRHVLFVLVCIICIVCILHMICIVCIDQHWSVLELECLCVYHCISMYYTYWLTYWYVMACIACNGLY